MKRFLSLVFIFCAFHSAMSQNIYTSAKNFRGHLQGIAVDDSAIYGAFAYEVAKFDYNGKLLKRVPAPFHSGDMTADGEKFYCSVSLHNSELIKKYGARNCIFVYDKELTLLEIRPLKSLYGIDGIAYIKGKFYIGLNKHGNALRMKNRIAILDRNFKLQKIATVTIGRNTKYGAQTLNEFNGKLLAGFYGGGKTSFIFDLEALEKSDTVVTPIGTLKANTTVGFSELPPAVAEKGTFIVVRNTRCKRQGFGAKFLVQKLDKDGNLIPTSLKQSQKQ
jgi:hypothetical protein